MTPEDIAALVEEQRKYFKRGATLEASFRRRQLERLRGMLRSNQDRIQEAVYEDLRKPPFEMFASEIALLLAEVDYALKRLACWTSPTKVPAPRAFFGADCRVYPEPYGVALIMSPWNYPFVLLFAPLIGAMAAGNCSVLKPSEISSHSAYVISELVSETFDPRYIAAVEGGMEVNLPLLEQEFDYIFFTGGTAVGREVMKAAAEHLTPITLELGGKSPCIVDECTRLRYAARRIAFGKWLNAGQTCIAPDYLLVHRDVKARLLEELKHAVRSFYGTDPRHSRHYARIIDSRHFERLSRLLEEGDIVIGGESDASDLYIAPTVIDEPGWDSLAMREEIFGPILPVLAYGDLDEAIEAVNSRPKPLALYFFSPDKEKQGRILRETSAGGACINTTMLQESTQTLPFGGVGNSGMGSYHGRHSFDTFTHYKGVLDQRLPLDMVLRPPYPDSRAVNRVLQRLLLSGRKCRS
ncbi:MAG: aldehyde dehydrogenase [Actinobacteria bacterium]|nr:aldehyde dehydrogenase [Actinomycetota bacterium]